MVFWGILALAALVWLSWRIYRKLSALVLWHWRERPGMGYYLATLVLPLLIGALPLLGLLRLAALSGPASESGPFTAQGRVSDYLTDTYQPSRYGSPVTYLAGLYLEGDPACYRLPGRSFDPEEFLVRLGPEAVTLQYRVSGTGARYIYSLTTGGGEELLTWEEAADIRRGRSDTLTALLVGLLLWGTGWALGLPEYLSRTGNPEFGSRRIKVALSLAGYVVLVALMLLPDSNASAHPIYTPVELEGMGQLALPGEWDQERGEGEDVWYSQRRDVSLSFRCYDMGTPQASGQTEGLWCKDVFGSFDDFLLETFLEPGTKPLFQTWEPVDLPGGQAGWVSQGGGRSVGGSLNWFVVAAFPAEGWMVTVQASTWDMDWEELEDYAQESVRPLVAYIEFT